MISQELEIADLKLRLERALEQQERYKEMLLEAKNLLKQAKAERTEFVKTTQRWHADYQNLIEDLRAVESVLESIPHWIVRLFWKRKA